MLKILLHRSAPIKESNNMQTLLRHLFAPPVFPEDEEKTHSAGILNAVSWSVIGILLILFFLYNVPARAPFLRATNLTILSIISIAALTLFISRVGYIRAASFILITTGWIGLSYLAWENEGIRDAAFFGYFLPILMASLLLGWRGAIGFSVASIISGWILAYAQTIALLVPTLDPPFSFARDTTIGFVLIGILIYLMISSLQNALKKSRAATRELSLSNKELTGLRVDLESRVEERTSELTRRSIQMAAVSSVARTIASVQDINELLPAITRLVSEQFGFFHVGIFLLDEGGEKAVLRAANSAGGLQMLGERYSLSLDEHSIVGHTISRHEPRIALDVGTDSVYFNNPYLPETRSEMALPLRVADRVIGALDVQSTKTNAFSQEDIGVIATLADQIAIAIENARLFGEAQKALNDARAMFEKYTRQDWSIFSRQVKQKGFLFDGKQVVPLDDKIDVESLLDASKSSQHILEKASNTIAIPITLRGQTIGVLDVRSKKGEREWKQDEITLLEAAAERAALALENARLVDSAQRRAARERAIGDISAHIGAVSNLESILQTTVEELGRKIGGATEVTLEIGTDDQPS